MINNLTYIILLNVHANLYFQVSSTLHAFWSIKVSQIGYQQRAHVRTVSYYTSFAAVSTSNNIQATSFSHAVINGSIKIIWKQTHC